ncbi:hypothetical protein ACIBQ1_35600 [Nonomuraea sp. NPDC050153]|uniref:hypothetical protein n=1 Tax=Nonomuraea sp. NPDC050153 TaxID=3364359 RepID=UPI00378747D0
MIWLLLVALALGAGAVHTLRCHGPSGDPALHFAPISQYETTPIAADDTVSCVMAFNPSLSCPAVLTSVLVLLLALGLWAGRRSDTGERRGALLPWHGRGPPSWSAPDLSVLSVLRI